MNKQKTSKGRGISWTDYTWNPIAGCLHGCAWAMPDGTVANCYAEDVANRVALAAYPQGFEHHYWKPELLAEPIRLNRPSKIFVGSMADVFGHWVPDEQIQTVLDICAVSPQHTFQFLTKNPQRLKQFHFPKNCWVGISSPPDWMWGKPLTRDQQERMLWVSLWALDKCNAKVKWMSLEPLSWDICGPYHLGMFVDWAVIGAASSGKAYHQPDPKWVYNLIDEFHESGTAVFYKENLRGNPAADPWREEFPA